MNRPLRASLAALALTSTATLTPLVADAASAPSLSECGAQQLAVGVASRKVDLAVRALAHAGGVHRERVDVRRARKHLLRAKTAFARAEDALRACGVAARPSPAITPTPAPAPAPVTFVQGTTRLGEVEPDLSPIPAISTWDGVPLGGTGFGSAFTADPAHAGYFYGLTDRGPNVTAPDGSAKLEPMAGFQDQIGWFHRVGGTLQLVKTIGLSLPSGEPMGGLVNSAADTGETIIDQYGDVLPKSSAGFDSEGLVALADGTFWVSDEYGPFVAHLDATGRELSRFDPHATTASAGVQPLPGELVKRRPNRGMEGLTLTGDGRYLVGIMQSSLEKNAGPGVAPTTSATGSITRIVKISLSDPTDVHEYLYYLHGGASDAAGQAASEITAVPGGDGETFVVDERDGKVEGTRGGAVKNLWRIDLAHATDVGPRSPLIGTTTAGGTVAYDRTVGLTIGGKTIEDLAGTRSGADASSALAAAGVSTGAESLFLDYAGLVSAIDPGGMYFGHDKVEGVTFDPADPNLLYLANDSDFGITDLPRGANPTAEKRARGTEARKTLPDDTTQDFGEVLLVDLRQVPARYRG